MSLQGAAWWGMTFQKTDGTPYSGVLAYHYEPGGAVARTAYTDEPATTNAANPVVGDTRGFVSFYGYGNYRILVTASVADGAATLFDGVVKLENRPSGIREEVQATSYPTATSGTRGLMFFKTTAGGDISSVGVNKDATGFSDLRFSGDAPTNTEVWAKGADIASASTLTLGNDGNYWDVTGAVTITTISAKTAGTVIFLQFDSTPQLTHSASLRLANSQNHVCQAHDVFCFVSDGSGNWREVARLSRLVTGMQLTNAIITAGSLSGTLSGTYTLSGTATFLRGAAISGASPVTPNANALYTEGLCKAWAQVNSTPAILKSHNIVSVADGGAGVVNVTINTDFDATDNYVVVCNTVSGNHFAGIAYSSAGTFVISLSTASDQQLGFACFGTQA